MFNNRFLCTLLGLNMVLFMLLLLRLTNPAVDNLILTDVARLFRIKILNTLDDWIQSDTRCEKSHAKLVQQPATIQTDWP